jgi:hypothetical protein
MWETKYFPTKLEVVNSHVESNTPNGLQLESTKRQYTYEDVSKITNNFAIVFLVEVDLELFIMAWLMTLK